MMELTREERRWLAAYRRALDEKYPGTIVKMLLYGSKARGKATLDSDLDLLLVVKDRCASRKRQIRRVGYLLAAASDILPSILAYTESE
jgi:predicted nucleotidyltransferase